MLIFCIKMKKSSTTLFSPCDGTWEIKFIYINVILYHFIVKVSHSITLKSFKGNMPVRKQHDCVVSALTIWCIAMWDTCVRLVCLSSCRTLRRMCCGSFWNEGLLNSLLQCCHQAVSHLSPYFLLSTQDFLLLPLRVHLRAFA